MARILGSRTETINQSIIINYSRYDDHVSVETGFFEHCMADMFAIDICSVLLQFLPCAKHEQHHTIRNDACRQRSNLVDQVSLIMKLRQKRLTPWRQHPKTGGIVRPYHQTLLRWIKHVVGHWMWCHILATPAGSFNFFFVVHGGVLFTHFSLNLVWIDKPLISIPHFGSLWCCLIPYNYQCFRNCSSFSVVQAETATTAECIKVITRQNYIFLSQISRIGLVLIGEKTESVQCVEDLITSLLYW